MGSLFGKKLKRLFNKKSTKSKTKIKEGRREVENALAAAAADEMYFSCSESFDDADEEVKGFSKRFSFGKSSNDENNNKKKNKELANAQPDDDDPKGLRQLHNIVVTSEQKEMLKKVIAKDPKLFDSNGHMEESRVLSGRSLEIFERISSRNGGPIKEEDFDPQVLVRHSRVAIENNPTKTIEEQIEYMRNQLECIREWRGRLGADSALRDYEKIPNQKEYFDLWPLHIHGNDAYGHLIFVEKIAEVDVDYLKTIMSVEEALHVRMVCHEAIAELKKRQSKVLDKVVYKHIWVMDLADIKWSSFTHDVRDALHKILKMCIEQYSDTLYRIIMINTPVIFRMVYKGASLVIKPATKKKVRMLGPTKHPATYEAFRKLGVTRENAPPCAGGTNKGVDILDLVQMYSKELKHERKH